jgi:predicted Fe-Mo cluster-binding NifX family protein
MPGKERLMKIAVSASGADLDSPVDPRFGRCQYLAIVDSDSMAHEATANPAATAPGGAGIQAANLVVQKGADVVLTGRCGPNASQVFQGSNVRVISGIQGTVREAVEQYLAGPSAIGTRSQSEASGHVNLDQLRAEVNEMGRRLDRMNQDLENLGKAET